MVMDTGIRELSGMINGFNLLDPLPPNQQPINTSEPDDDPENFFNHSRLLDPPFFLSAAGADGVPAPPSSTSPDGHSSEDSEIFSDIALSYISEMLMEENMDDDRVYLCQGGPALQAAVKPFVDALGEGYPDSSTSPEDSSNGHGGNSFSPGGGHSGVGDYGCLFEFVEHPSPPAGGVSVDYSPQTSFGSSNSTNSILEVIEDPRFITGGENDFEIGIQPIWQYNKGVEEATKFLPDQNKLVVHLEANTNTRPLPRDQNSALSRGVDVKVEKEEDKECSPVNGSRSRKNPHHDHEDLELEEGRNTKQSAVSSSSEEEVRSDMFDKVLLCPPGRPNEAISSLREALQNEVSKASKNGHSKGANGGKSRGRRQPKKEVVDLRTLLIHCAQAVATDDRRSAGELLKQIRQHSPPDGDGSQRLAHCFAEGLEARMAGTGSDIYHSLAAKTQSAAVILKAYHLYLAACPFKKISHYFANQTILNVAEGASRLHIVDFGIYFGFQWPCLIQRLSLRPGGPPKLRITGIEVPQPGFRPTARVEETGRRLADYARSFGVPFEYRAIAARWDSVKAEDLKVGRDEVLVVNCLYRFRNLVDETVVVDSPRNRVLHNIRKMKPDVLIHGVVNGAYGAPFFVTRFREALFHFSAMFDMLEATVPREHPERKLLEREIFGREAMNVIACEGSERVERPETYKQWQARNLRAGFVQLQPNAAIVRKSKEKVRSCYHKDFLVDEDSGWLLQGWKGRIIYALSTWRPGPAGF